jgi:heme-degrading monooxygenase HmoA
MIVRTWSARATKAGAEAYSAYFESTLFPQLRQLRGFSGAYLLARDDGDLVELTAHTIWESLDSIRAFAGDDFTTAVVEPEALAVLEHSDTTVVHRDVLLHVKSNSPAHK